MVIWLFTQGVFKTGTFLGVKCAYFSLCCENQLLHTFVSKMNKSSVSMIFFLNSCHSGIHGVFKESAENYGWITTVPCIHPDVGKVPLKS